MKAERCFDSSKARSGLHKTPARFMKNLWERRIAHVVRERRSAGVAPCTQAGAESDGPTTTWVAVSKHVVRFGVRPARPPRCQAQRPAARPGARCIAPMATASGAIVGTQTGPTAGRSAPGEGQRQRHKNQSLASTQAMASRCGRCSSAPCASVTGCPWQPTDTIFGQG